MYIFVAIPGDLVCYIHYTQLRLGSFQILSDYMWLKSPVSDCVVKAHWKISEVAGKTCSQLYLLQTLNILIYSYYLFLPICAGVHGLVLYIRVYHLLHGWFGYEALSWAWLCGSCLTLWKLLKLYGHLFLTYKMQELKYIVFILLKSLFWSCVNFNPGPKVSALRNWEEVDLYLSFYYWHFKHSEQLKQCYRDYLLA